VVENASDLSLVLAIVTRGWTNTRRMRRQPATRPRVVRPKVRYVAEMSEQETILINSRSAASKYAAVTAG